MSAAQDHRGIRRSVFAMLICVVPSQFAGIFEGMQRGCSAGVHAGRAARSFFCPRAPFDA